MSDAAAAPGRAGPGVPIALGLLVAATAALAALTLVGEYGASPPGFTGRWRFSGPDASGRPAFPLCLVEITQRGDRADLTASALDGGDWSCTGRGAIEGRTLRFHWAGEKKGWRGTATFTLEGAAIRGTYKREDARSENLECVGERER